MMALRELAGKKKWIDSQVIQTILKINETLFPSEFNIAVRTLNHIYVVDQIFKAHLLGVPHTYDSTNTTETPNILILGEALRRSDDWYVEYVENLNDEQLTQELRFKFTDGDLGLLTRQQILFHVFDHGTNHRGNIAQIFKNMGITPPRDLLTRYIRLSRSGEL
jgi:uncharacterized damage-inducible protein DinB